MRRARYRVPSSMPPPSARVSPLRRGLFAGAGLVCVAVAVVGIALPGLPTTPFLLVAAYLFARGSPRLADWLAEHRVLGPYLRAVRGKRAMSLPAKFVTIAVLWTTVGASVWMLARAGTTGQIVAPGLLAVAAIVTWFVGFRLGSVRGSRRD